MQKNGGLRRLLKRQREPRTTIVSFHIPRGMLKTIDELVEMGVFNNRSEAIRIALYNLIRDLERERERARKPVLG
jgi:Arc/MetJ-type ribon-helix-helix transcriptional regulator